MDVKNRKCCLCHIIKPINEFYTDKHEGGGGYEYRCKLCSKKYHKQHQYNLNVDIKNRLCYICKINKPIKEFYKSKYGTGGYEYRCKLCSISKHNQYRIKNHVKCNEYDKMRNLTHKDYQNDWQLKKNYGISLEQKNKMILDQDKKCACCGDFLGIDSKNMHIDHNHITKKVRSILCGKCNWALGMMDENVDKILKLAEYAKWCNTLK
jgi:hypothetical protein